MKSRIFGSDGCADAMCEAAEQDRAEFEGSPEGNAMAAMQEDIAQLRAALKHIAEFEQDIYVSDASAISYMRETAKSALAYQQPTTIEPASRR